MDHHHINQSLWLTHRPKPKEYPVLKDDIICDVAIIGAGITGLSTAMGLKDSGLNTVVLEGSRIGLGTTGYSSAKVTYQHGIIYAYLLKTFGREKALQYLDANIRGMTIMREHVEQGIKCDYKEQPAYIYAVDEWGMEQLKEEKNAYDELGIEGEMVRDVQLPIDAVGALRILGQAQIDPIKYLDGMADILARSNVQIYENTRVEDIRENKDGYSLWVNGASVRCHHLVMASHFPINFEGLYFARMHQERSYVLALEGVKEQIEGLFINAGETFYSVRHCDIDGRRIYLLGGANHQSAENIDESSRYDMLEQLAKRIFPDGEVVTRWSNQDCMSLDGVPYIGRTNTARLYVGTGYNKWGIAFGAVAGEIIAKQIKSENTDAYEIFDPKRGLHGKAAKELLKNAGSAIKGFASRLKTDEASLGDIGRNEGRVVHIQGRRIGVYRDDMGKLWAVRAVCTHLGCALCFNEAEKTWDCPCHGSRFDINGRVLEGPAVDDLEMMPIALEDE